MRHENGSSQIDAPVKFHHTLSVRSRRRRMLDALSACGENAPDLLYYWSGDRSVVRLRPVS
jgi:hypothetical protein